MAAIWIAYRAHAALARGELTEARRWADAVAATTGWHRSFALTTRALVAIFQGEPEQAERDAHDALAIIVSSRGYAAAPAALECLAVLAVDAGSHREAARFFGGAEAIRQRTGEARFKFYDAPVGTSVAALRDALGEKDFESTWAEGSGLSTDEAIAYAQRRRENANAPAVAGRPSRPPSATSYGWSAKGSPTTTSPRGFSSHHAPCKPTSPTSTPNSDSPRACNSRRKQPGTADPARMSDRRIFGPRDSARLHAANRPLTWC
jgi:hypothetical protein